MNWERKRNPENNVLNKKKKAIVVTREFSDEIKRLRNILRFSTSFAIRDTEIKTILIVHLTRVRMAKIKYLN